MGLSNLDDRLKTLYEDNYLFKIENCSGGGVKSKIRLPIDQ